MGQIYVTDDLVNSAAYWKQKPMGVQGMEAWRGWPSLIINITWREDIQHLWIDKSNRGARTAQRNRPRSFNRPDLIAMVEN